MTDVVESVSPTQLASQWLTHFDRALSSNNIDAALELCVDEPYWRDLVTFTWNIKTAEGKDQIRHMLQATLAQTQPSNWKIEGPATEAGGIIDAWFTFETGVARGKGHLRLMGGKCFTLLTTMTELKGFEERSGANRVKGAEHGPQKDRKSWLERKTQEEAELG